MARATGVNDVSEISDASAFDFERVVGPACDADCATNGVGEFLIFTNTETGFYGVLRVDDVAEDRSLDVTWWFQTDRTTDLSLGGVADPPCEVVFETVGAFDEGAWFNAGPGDRSAQTFEMGDGDAIRSVIVRLDRVGSPHGTVRFELFDESGSGTPGKGVAELGAIPASAVDPNKAARAGQRPVRPAARRAIRIWTGYLRKRASNLRSCSAGSSHAAGPAGLRYAAGPSGGARTPGFRRFDNPAKEFSSDRARRRAAKRAGEDAGRGAMLGGPSGRGAARLSRDPEGPRVAPSGNGPGRDSVTQQPDSRPALPDRSSKGAIEV